MDRVKLGARLMDHTLAYRLWQAPFASAKLAPLFRHNDVRAARRVLDVGCGPGTNTAQFAHSDYLGVDFNERYIEYARRRYGREFLVADITTYFAPAEERFDLVLVNSFLHHIDTANVRRILSHLSTLLSEDGHVHVFDLVLPERASVARLLARSDRGQYPRPLAQWRALFVETFEPVALEPYPLGLPGLTLWNMVYFKGRRRR